MIHPRGIAWIPIAGMIATLFSKVQADCTLSYGEGNPYPWLVRVWNRGRAGTSDPICQGVIIHADKVITPCTTLQEVKSPQFFLTGYHYHEDGTFDCLHHQLIFTHEDNALCGEHLPAFDFTVWTLPYPFTFSGTPLLFPYRPPNEDFDLSLTRTTNKTRCELPIFNDNTEETEVRALRMVHFAPLDDCLRLYCPEDDEECLQSLNSGYVYCAYAFHRKGEKVWPYKIGQSWRRDSDPVRGAILICDDFPMGMVGAVLYSTDDHKDYRILSSFYNIINELDLPPKPTGISTLPPTTTTVPTARRTAKKKIVTSSRPTTTAAPLTEMHHRHWTKIVEIRIEDILTKQHLLHSGKTWHFCGTLCYLLPVSCAFL